MKTYTIRAAVEEHDLDTDELCDAMGLAEMIGPFATLDAAQRFLCSLPIETKGSPSLEALANSAGFQQATPDGDLFEALTDAIACSKSAHEDLHAFEAGLPPQTCAEAIRSIVDTVTMLLAPATEMVEQVRRDGRSWTSLTLDQKDRMLRPVIEDRTGAGEFAPVHMVPWNPAASDAAKISAGGCPARLAMWRELLPWFSSAAPSDASAPTDDTSARFHDAARTVVKEPIPGDTVMPGDDSSSGSMNRETCDGGR